MEKLSKLDWQILDILTKDARTPVKEIAEMCDASRSAATAHHQYLLSNGTIKHLGFDVASEYLGYETCTYVGIKLEKGSYYKDIVPYLEAIDEIVECHYTTGPYAMLVKLYAANNADLLHILCDVIQMIPGVVDTETLISLKTTFERGIKPVPRSK